MQTQELSHCNGSILPIFAPMKGIHFNADCAKQELLPLYTASKLNPVYHRDGQSAYDSPDLKLSHALGFDSSLATHYNINDNTVVAGNLNTFHSIHLTWIPGVEETKTDQFFKDNSGYTRGFIFSHDHDWTWRDDIKTPYMKGVIQRIPFASLQMVRVLFIQPPGGGGAHIDALPTAMDKYYSEGHFSITLNISAGGAELKFLSKGIVHTAGNNLAWHFNPSVPHGVTPVRDLRIQVRIFGKMDPNQYRQLLDLSRAIW